MKTDTIPKEQKTEINLTDLKLISGSEFYFINQLGMVYNAKSQKVLKPYINKKSGFLMVMLGYTPKNLAKLLIDTFGNQKNKTNFVRFKDGNKQNISIDNLEYCTLSDLQKGKPKTQNKTRNQTTKTINLAEFYKYYIESDNKSLISLLGIKSEKRFIESEILRLRNETKDKYLPILLLIDYTNGKEINELSKKYEISIKQTKEYIKQARIKIISDIETDISKGLFINFEIQAPKQKKRKKDSLKTWNELKKEIKL